MENLFETYLKAQEGDIKPVILGSKGTLARLKPSNPNFINRFESEKYGYLEVIECDDYIAVAIVLKTNTQQNKGYFYLTNLSLADLLKKDNVDTSDFVKFKVQ